MSDKYSEFLHGKAQFGEDSGFDPVFMPDFLFPFQQSLVEWATRKGRAAIFANCGLGKSPMQLTWAQNVVEKTNKSVLIIAPLAVSHQTSREGDKFGIECKFSRDGKANGKIVVTNYEKLHHFNPSDFIGVVSDESSRIKDADSKTRHALTEFMRLAPYRLLCTATVSPNDYTEIGTSSEVLGYLGHMDMMGRFFKADNGSVVDHISRRFSKNPFGSKFRFRGHAEKDFWRWMCSWSRSIQKPSDLGFDDADFILPPLSTTNHIVDSTVIPDGFLFASVAIGLKEQRQERRNSLSDRCEKASSLIRDTGNPAIAWCNLNDEGDMLEEMIPDAIQVSGSDSDDAKEEKLLAFINGESRVLVTKPVLAAMGLNMQHCAHQTWFPSHSFEQWYQGIRRSWRFGQKNPVQIDVVTSEGEAAVLANLQRKSARAEEMFARLVESMGNELGIKKSNPFTNNQTLPTWLK